MLKRTLAFAGILSATSFALGQTPPPYHANNTLWPTTLSRTMDYYVGIGVGRDSNTLEDKLNGYVVNHGVGGFTGELLHGVQIPLPANFGVAIENNWAISTAEEKIKAPGSTQKLTKPYTIGLSVLPNYQTYSLGSVFLRLGAVYSEYKATGTEIELYNFKKWVLGGQIGVGYTFDLSYHTSLRGEYDYSLYKSFTTTTGGETLTPRSNQFMLSFLVRF